MRVVITTSWPWWSPLSAPHSSPIISTTSSRNPSRHPVYSPCPIDTKDEPRPSPRHRASCLDHRALGYPPCVRHGSDRKAATGEHPLHLVAFDMLLTFSTPRWRRLRVQSRVVIHARPRTQPVEAAAEPGAKRASHVHTGRLTEPSAYNAAATSGRWQAHSPRKYL